MDKRQQIIEVIAYDPDWPHQYALEVNRLEAIFGDEIQAIHHMDQYNSSMLAIGYEAWGDYHIAGRRFFVKGETQRTHHLHVFQKGTQQIARHLALRDYLIHHPDEANRYGELKLTLAEKFRHNRRAYVLNKQDFVRALEKRALDWFHLNQFNVP